MKTALERSKLSKTQLGKHIPVGMVLLAVVLLSAGGVPQAWAQQPPNKTTPVEDPDPLVQALLETQPREPSELVGAIKLLLSRGRPELAQQFVQKLLQAKLDDPGWSQLVLEHGLDAFSQMAQEPKLAPAGQQLYRRVLQALQRHLKDPQRLRQAASQLEAASAQQRYEAFRTLALGGEQAAVAVLEHVAQNRPKNLAPYVAILSHLGAQAHGPLRASLNMPQHFTWPLAVEVVARQQWAGAVPYLMGVARARAFSAKQRQVAQRALVRILGRRPDYHPLGAHWRARVRKIYYSPGEALWPEPTFTQWQWVGERLQGQQYPRVLFPAIRARELIMALHRGGLSTPALIRINYACMTEQLKWQRGVTRPLEPNMRFVTNPQHALEVLQEVLDHPRGVAQVGLLEYLYHHGNAQLLYTSQGESPVVLALAHPQAMVRHAALRTIFHWQPKEPFPGCHRVVEALTHLVRAHDTRVVLLGMQGYEAASRIAGVLRPLGYEVVLCRTTQEVFRQATTRPDCELVLVDPYLPGVPIRELVQRLRADFRTQGVVVATLLRYDPLAPGGRTPQVPGVPQFVPIEKTEDAREQLERLLAGRNALQPSREQRVLYAQSGLHWAAQWLEQPPPWLELRSREEVFVAALGVQALRSQAVEVLSRLGTPRSQQVLLEPINQGLYSLQDRRKCLEGFRASVKRFGLLLTPRQILAQYHRYNRSATEDPQIQALLSAVLDVIEQAGSGDQR